MQPRPLATEDLRDRTCLVTGASSGIGLETAAGLAGRGARVVLLCRNRERAEAAQAEIRARTGSDQIEVLLADLAVQAEIRRAAEQILERCPALHVLVNNAGVFQLQRTTTPDGYESSFAVNHLAYFLLTRLLLERLVATPGARIVSVASEAHRFAGGLDFDDLQSERQYWSWRVYGRSKLCNILFNAELARRLEGTGVTANCCHPGGVATGLGSGAPAWVERPVRALTRLFLLSPERGASTSLYLATDPAVASVTGRYFANEREKTPSADARNPALAARLWRVSEELTGLA